MFREWTPIPPCRPLEEGIFFVRRVGKYASKKFLPFKGEVRRGMGAHDPRITNDDSGPHPHPGPPLEGEGMFFCGVRGEYASKEFLPLQGGGEEGDGGDDLRITNHDSGPILHSGPPLKKRTFIG